MLLVVSASSIVKLNSWYMLWYSRMRGGVILPWSLLDPHVRAREDRGGQADERRQRHQEHVQRVDEELVGPRANSGPPEIDARRQRAGGDEGAQAEGDVDVARDRAVADEGEHDAAGERDAEHEDERLHGQSSFSFSRWRMSRLSNCSRIWNMNTPRIRMPTSTSSAMPSSTTIGMP